MTSKEVTQVYYLNLCIIQYPYVISIYQTSHIHDTILAQWFPDAYENINSSPTPFKVDISFELILAEILPYNPAEIHLLEERYLGKFSSRIVNNLRIMQYNFPYIMSSINLISSHASSPSVISLKVIKHLIRYLDFCPHFPILYPLDLISLSHKWLPL